MYGRPFAYAPVVEVKSTLLEQDAERLIDFVHIASLPPLGGSVSSTLREGYESKAYFAARDLWRRLLNEYHVDEPVDGPFDDGHTYYEYRAA